MSNALEAMMLICFGLSWPISVYKNIKSHSAKNMSFRFNLLIIIGYLAGILANKLEGMEGVTLLHAKSAGLRPHEGSSVNVEVDGELAGSLPATVEIVPDALTLLMPPEFLSWTT